jgi:hypothetical protein
MKQSVYFIILIFFCITTSDLFSNHHHVVIENQSIQVEIQPEQHLAKMEVNLKFKAPQKTDKFSFLINKEVKDLAISLNNTELEYDFNPDFKRSKYLVESDSSDENDLKIASEVTVKLPKKVDSSTLLLKYNLPASDQVDQAAFSREYIAYQIKGYIGNKGIFISPAYFWYPTIPEQLSNFKITAITQDTLQILTQGRLEKEEVINNVRHTEWAINYPANSIHLVGSRYEVRKTAYKNIDIYTYFFPESQELSQSYLDACVRYMVLYEELIGPYPFSKFAVVENFFPTGYGMPSYTLLGSQVIRLPFIIYTSLGHEVAHNWWGNSVYIDYNSGNWCEGLTTYFADHYYKAQRSSADAVGYRRDLARDFTVYVKDQKDFPLNQFSARTESSSRAIGYGKSAMVFHQLRKILGDSLFFESFRVFYKDYRFKDASWTDIKESAEKTSGQNLDWYFQQWVERKGAPQVTLKKVTFANNVIQVTLNQDPVDTYRLYVPVRITLKDSTIVDQYVWLEEAEQTFKFPVQGIPQEIAVDPDFDFLRKLQRNEIPPSLSEIYAEETSIYVLPDKVDEAKLNVYKKFAETMSEGDEGTKIISVNEVSQSDIDSYSMYILGNPSENSLLSKVEFEDQKEFQITDGEIVLNSTSTPNQDEVTVLAARAPQNGKTVCIIAIGENQQTGRIANLLSHYGKYSYLVFNNGKNQVKDIYSSNKSPMIYSFD